MAWIENLGEILLDPISYGEFIWTLPNLYDTETTRPCIGSPWFCLEGDHFRIVLRPTFDYVGLFVWQNSLNSNRKRYEIDILWHVDGGASKWVADYDPFTRSYYKEYNLNYKWIINPNEDCGKWNFLLLSELVKQHEKISPQGKLTISWKMSVLPELQGSGDICAYERSASLTDDPSIEDNKHQNAMTGAKGVQRLQQNFEKLLQDGQNSDVILKVEGREFMVHRCVLSVRSPVFASMFQHDMAERNSDAVDIPDCSSEAFEVFLRYLYTGSTSGAISAEIICNLYYAADKYQVQDLKEDCVEFMKKTLSVDSFCDIISLALRHCELELLKMATDFFRVNVRNIIKTVQWRRYNQQNPTQANELLIKALNA